MAIRVSNVTAQILFDASEISREISEALSFTEEPFARKIGVSNLTVQILQLQPAPAGGRIHDSLLRSDVFFDSCRPRV